MKSVSAIILGLLLAGSAGSAPAQQNETCKNVRASLKVSSTVRATDAWPASAKKFKVSDTLKPAG